MPLKRRDFVLSPHTLRGAEHCEAARLLVPVEREKPSHAQWWGIGVHRFLEYAQRYDRDYALRYIKQKFPRAHKMCSQLDLDQLPIGDHEVQFAFDAFDLTGGVSIGEEHDPNRDVKAKADLYSTVEEVHVVDFKTGERIVDPATSIQMNVIAVGAWLDNQKPSTVRATVMNIVDGEFISTSVVYDENAIAAAAARVRRVMLSVVEARADAALGLAPEFTLGDHCEGCHARSACPKIVR